MKQIVYTANSENQRIYVWSLNYDGSLTLTQVVSAPGQVQPMVVSPDKRCLYVGVRPESRVLAYRIVPDDGALTFAAKSTLPGSPTYISTNHQGRSMFIDSYNAGSVSVMRLEDGLPVELVDVVEGLGGCHLANVSPDNRTLWAPALRQGHTCLFNVGDDSHLVVEEPAKVTTVESAGSHHMVFYPNKQYAYCMNELSSSIDVQELKDPYDKTERAQILDMMPADSVGTRWAADIHITPDGRHLYTCNRTANLITAFNVSEDGNVLTKEGFQPTEIQPCGFNIDNRGEYSIAAGQKPCHIAVYEIAGEQESLTEKGRYAVR